MSGDDKQGMKAGSDVRSEIVRPNAWHELRRYTHARIALGRAGNSLPTEEVLRLGLAHAQARDALHLPLNVDALTAELLADSSTSGLQVLRAHSMARDRAHYLLRPDHGRQLADASRQKLVRHAAGPHGLVLVIADGLSPLAVQRHAPPLLRALLPRLDGWKCGPVVVVEQGRVAIGDPIAELFDAEAVVVLIGERPGLSSPDSLGIYLTYAPRPGRTDAERNCISNIRPQGLPFDEAARRLAWLLNASRQQKQSGVGLKDESGPGLQSPDTDQRAP